MSQSNCIYFCGGETIRSFDGDNSYTIPGVCNWIKVAEINDSNITYEKSPTRALDALTRHIVETIIVPTQQSSIMTVPKTARGLFSVGPVNDRMHITFLSDLRYRRCMVWTFIQYSEATQKTRIVFYGSDLVTHHGMSFGTSLDIVQIEDIRESVRKVLPSFDLDKVTPASKMALENGTYLMF